MVQAEWVERYRLRFQRRVEIVEAMGSFERLHHVDGAHVYASQVPTGPDGMYSVLLKVVAGPTGEGPLLDLATYAEARFRLGDDELLLFIDHISDPDLRVRGVSGHLGRWNDAP